MASSFEELLGLGSYAGNHAAQGRVSVLNLQEVTGTTAFDTGGVGNNGTYWGTGSNPVSVPGPTAWLTNAVSFDGINVRVDYGGEVAPLDDWTIACWFRTTQTGNDRWIMSEGSTDSNTPGIGIVVQSGNLRCFCRSSGTVNLITSKTVNDGNWHFVQFSRSGIDFYVYCDGELITSGGSSVDNPATNISGIGCFRRASASLFAQAQIAGVYKFSRMLSLSEHQFLFAGPEGDEEPGPAEGSGASSAVVSTSGEGHRDALGLGEASLTVTVAGEGSSGSGGSGSAVCVVGVAGAGHTERSGSGSDSLSVAASGSGYRQSSGSGELDAIASTVGEGYSATGSYGETLLLASASGQGYVIRSGAGAAALAIGTAGAGRSAETSTTGVFAFKTSSGYFFIQSGNQ